MKQCALLTCIILALALHCAAPVDNSRILICLFENCFVARNIATYYTIRIKTYE